MIIDKLGQITVYAGEGAFKYFEKKYGKPKIKIEINSFDDTEEVERKAKDAIYKYEVRNNATNNR